MANPRKFSEKIALHNQKQAEETAAFNQIMREVSDATSKVNALPKQHLLINQSLGSYRGGSLPNVNNIGSSAVDLKSALGNPEEASCGRPDASPGYRERGRSVGVGPVRSRAADKRVDTSPYSSGAYLSPPPDTSWRRTNSDSALHQSALDPSQRRVTDGQLLGVAAEPPDARKPLASAPDGRPRSCCDARVPGINIFPSQQEPGTVQIPIGNNTGSLPDLTSFQFSSPLNTPLDQDSSSPYSSNEDTEAEARCREDCGTGGRCSQSPQGASPATLSPTSLSSRPLGRFSFSSSSPPQEGGPSPGHSPSARRRHYAHWHVPQSPTQLPNHLPVPSLMNSRYLHTCKGMAMDKTGNIQLDSAQQNHYLYQPPDPQQQQLQQQLQQQQQQVQQLQQQVQQQQQHLQQQQQCSPTLMSSPQTIPAVNTHHVNSLSSYRNPHHPISRPSPQTSPGLIVQGALYRSGSPGDTSHSGPQSPVSPASSPGIGSNSNPFVDHNSYFLNQAQANMLQQHFEQFSMLDHPVSTTIDYIDSPSNTSHYSQAVSGGSPEECLKQELGADPGYFSQPPSQLTYARPGSTQPQTPNTPSSIPDIILTDFSSGTADELSRQEFVKDLNSAMSGSFDSDLFPSDDTLREGLDPIDFDGLQMLTDPDINVITDPAAEDSFRLDRL